MQFGLTEEQKLIQQSARDFAQREIVPIAAEFDRTGEFPLRTIRMAGELGFMGVEVPDTYGGAGLDTIGYVLMMQEVSAADAAHGTIISVNNSLYCTGILKFGTEEQKRKYVTPVASGEVIAAYALTEPQSGSDAGNMRVRAQRSADGSEYVITGKKSWITSGPVAKFIILFAQTEVGAGSRGVTAFIIDTDKPGFARGKTEPKLGIRASATCEIELNDYRCPAGARLGAEGDGFKIAMAALDSGRIGIASQAVGIARAAYDAR
jgi:alkylation response protein AidB-like acyl-CoA dehydrogenase